MNLAQWTVKEMDIQNGDFVDFQAGNHIVTIWVSMILNNGDIVGYDLQEAVWTVSADRIKVNHLQ